MKKEVQTSMIDTIIERYNVQISKYAEIVQKTKDKVRIWSLIRFFSFLAFVALLILIYKASIIAGVLCTYLFIFLFRKIIDTHSKYSDQLTEANRVVELNQKEIQYLDDNYTDRSTGNNYEDKEHPYAQDLDLFGNRSLFQYIERCNTQFGKDTLASKLLSKSSQREISQNQIAITELISKLDWRQMFLGQGIKIDDSKLSNKNIRDWKETENIIKGNSKLIFLSYFLPIIGTILAAIIIYYYPFYYAIIAYLPCALLWKNKLDNINKLQELSNRSMRYISKYGRLINKIETENFNTEKLKILQSEFINTDGNTSNKLKKLDWILDQLEIKTNAFGALFNIITLWDLHFLRKLEKWKDVNKEKIERWTAALGEMEFLCSMANVAYNNPSWIFPEIGEGSNYNALELGHPLIHRKTRVNNDIDVKSKQHILLITGSNMAGKSTFQRSLGINLIMAYCGGKVCAKKAQLPDIQLVTSMRTVDALEENTSGFYAELKRLKMVLDAVKDTGQQNFFLIDEILKGTNTEDRHKGSRAMIVQLLKHGGAGIISTHDLRLAEMEKELEGKLTNKCFEVEVFNDKLSFDYKIKDGVSKSFNATTLMRNIGIDV